MKAQLKISDIKKIREDLTNMNRLMNSCGLDNIEFLDDDGNVVEIDQKIIDDYKYTGLNPVDFIATGFYESGFEN